MAGIDRTISGIPREAWHKFCINCAQVKGKDPEKVSLEELDKVGHWFLANLVGHVAQYDRQTLIELTALIYQVKDEEASIHLTDIPRTSLKAMNRQVVIAGYNSPAHYISEMIYLASQNRLQVVPKERDFEPGESESVVDGVGYEKS